MRQEFFANRLWSLSDSCPQTNARTGWSSGEILRRGNRTGNFWGHSHGWMYQSVFRIPNLTKVNYKKPTLWCFVCPKQFKKKRPTFENQFNLCVIWRFRPFGNTLPASCMLTTSRGWVGWPSIDGAYTCYLPTIHLGLTSYVWPTFHPFMWPMGTSKHLCLYPLLAMAQVVANA